MMKIAASVVVLVLVASAPSAASSPSPIDKVVQMLSDLEAKIMKEGTSGQKEFESYSEWCHVQGGKLEFEVKNGKLRIEQLQSLIEQDTSQVTVSITHIEESSMSIASFEKDLTEATLVRDREQGDFAAEEKELMDLLDTLERAIAILKREQSKHEGASMLQAALQHANTVVEALKVMAEASLFSAADASKLTALVQSSQASNDSDDTMDVGAPAAAVYGFASGGIIETLEGLLEKAEDQLKDARAKEQEAIHVFELLRLSLTDQIKLENKVIFTSKTTKSQMTHESATAKGDLSVTQQDFTEDTRLLQELRFECMTFASDFEHAVKSREEELKALATAKKVIQEQTGGAESAVYDSSFSQVNTVSFAQLASSSSSRLSSGLSLANFEVARFVRDLARKQNSPQLAQLSTRISSAVRSGSGEEHVFDKVKGLIADLIARLEAEGEKDVTHHAWCTKETAESTAKKEDMTALIEQLGTKLDQLKASSAQLQEQVAELQHELADLAQSQAEMDKMRAEEKATFITNKLDLQQGVAGVQMALKVLRDYYAKGDEGSAQGASTGIISLLEVVESDFSKALQEMIAQEASAQRAYDEQTKENEISRDAKDKEVAHKTKEYLEMDQNAKQIASDLDNTQAELDAILEALAKINEMCIAKAEPYAEKKRRREEEMAGLREALQMLEGEAVLLQQRAKHARRALRGGQALVATAVAA